MVAAENTPTLTLELGPGKVPYRDFRRIVGAFTRKAHGFVQSVPEPSRAGWAAMRRDAKPSTG